LEPLQAILWDVDGTLAETERDGHLAAFNLAFEACGQPWRWDDARYGRLLEIAGGRERVLYDMEQRAATPERSSELQALARAIHQKKNEFYGQLMRAGLVRLREGVLNLMQQCRERGVRMGISTTSGRANVEALLRTNLGLQWQSWFAVVVCGEDVSVKKPHPEVYSRALESLRVAPSTVLAIEDSPSGVESARAAGVQVIVTRSAYFAEAPIEGALAVGPGLHDRTGWRPSLASGPAQCGTVDLDDIAAWRAW
jgi:HAD superfamily hydrolase (TIGR01509 family)